MAAAGCFSFVKLYEVLLRCKDEDESVGLDAYIEGYEEVIKFLELLGPAFYFVISDIKSKLSILREHRSSNWGAHYSTIQSMVDFEVDRGITKMKAKLPSGSRTLLRLHRALEFCAQFLQNIQALSDEGKLSTAASTAYDATLARYHPSVVHELVHVATWTLPNAATLLVKIMVENRENTNRIIGQIVAITRWMYDTVEEVYSDNDILNLP